MRSFSWIQTESFVSGTRAPRQFLGFLAKKPWGGAWTSSFLSAYAGLTGPLSSALSMLDKTRLGRQALATRAVHKDGNRLYVELSFAVVKDRAGKVAGALGIARDITSRYVSDSEMRKRLSELEQKLKELAQNGSAVSALGQGKSD